MYEKEHCNTYTFLGMDTLTISSTHPISLPGVEAQIDTSTNLLALLSNHLISSRIIPYLPVASVLAVASTNRAYHALITKEQHNSSAFRYLDLSQIRCAQLKLPPMYGGQRSEQIDEALTEDDFYSGPLKGVFRRLEKTQTLEWVSTMVLDGLCVPTEVVRQIIMEDRFQVRILSIRDVTQLNVKKLCQILNYVTRPSRPEGTPKLKGLYVFGPKDPLPVKEEEHGLRRRSPTRFPESRPSDTVRAVGASLSEDWNKRSQETLAQELGETNDKWYHSAGKIIAKTPRSEWAETLMACQGIIHFDAVLCRGPRHTPASYSGEAEAGSYLPPAIATIALGPKGCEMCKSCPEGPAVFGRSSSHEIPLLSPIPFSSYTIRAAQMPSSSLLGGFPRIIARCADCLRGRWCERCHKWWCEPCYDPNAVTIQPQPQHPQSHGTIAAHAERLQVSKQLETRKVHDDLCDECYLQNWLQADLSEFYGDF